MGIINVNDDSFCNDGSLNIDDVVQQAIGAVSQGADIIDVGAESARTNREVITVEKELARFTAFIDRWGEVIEKSSPRDSQQVWPPVLSVNTWRQEVVEKLLPLGGDILNDMSGLQEGGAGYRNASIAAEHNAALLIMHSVGEPKVAHTHQQWEAVMDEMRDFFTNKVSYAKECGLRAEQLIIDPGIDFAKQKADNLRVYASLHTIVEMGHCVMVPVSRKTVIGDVLGIHEPVERDAGTAACIVDAMQNGAQMFRVHNVKAAFEVIKTIWEVQRS